MFDQTVDRLQTLQSDLFFLTLHDANKGPANFVINFLFVLFFPLENGRQDFSEEALNQKQNAGSESGEELQTSYLQPFLVGPRFLQCNAQLFKLQVHYFLRVFLLFPKQLQTSYFNFYVLAVQAVYKHLFDFLALGFVYFIKS